MRLGNCHQKLDECFVVGTKVGNHSSLNVNGPLQLGGISFDPMLLQMHYNWKFVPTSKPFFGCISNLTLNGEVRIQIFFFVFQQGLSRSTMAAMILMK